MTNKRISTPIGIIIIVIFALLATGIMAYQYSWLSKSVGCTKEAKVCPGGTNVSRIPPNCEFAICPTTSSDETADWKTYRNEKLGFEVKYPPSLVVKEEDNGLTEIYNFVDGGFNVEHRVFYDSSLGRNWTPEELIKNSLRGSKIESAQIVLDGIPATETAFCYGTAPIIQIVTQKPGDERILNIDIEPHYPNIKCLIDSGPILPAFEGTIFDKMLSTFKFIKK